MSATDSNARPTNAEEIETYRTLNAVIEIAFKVVERSAGNDISTGTGGKIYSPEDIKTALRAKITKHIK
jgi:hypothetical protein